MLKEVSSGRSLMYSGKSVGPKMEPQGTPALTGYSYEDFQCRSTPNGPLLRKDKLRPNIWPEIPKDLILRRPACQTALKAVDISSATARVTPDLFKTIAILSDTTVRKSAVDWEDLKPYGELENRLHFSRWSASLLFKGSSKTLLTGW